MTDPMPDSPERSARVAKALLVISPFAAALAYGLAAIQGADTRSSFIIAGVMFAMCLVWALLYYLRGSKAVGDMGWINLILRLITRR